MAVSRRERITKELLVDPGTDANIAGRDPAWTGGPEFEQLSGKQLSHTAKALLADGVKELSKAQELLWASDTYALLVVFQALDAAGKDSTIEHVMSGVNPQGVHVVSFKQPSSEELDHDFLWRSSKALPERGRIGIFNRSHYEEVVALRVHPEWLTKQKLPPGPHGPGKQWKFSAADLSERAHWDDYMRAFEEAITATSTPWAPWYVIPADHKPVMQAMVAAILVDTIGSLDLSWPEVSEQAEEI